VAPQETKAADARFDAPAPVAPHEVAPAEFAHPLLPVPKMQPSPVVVSENAPVKVTEIATTANESLPVGAPKMLNPIEYARALKTSTAVEVAANDVNI